MSADEWDYDNWDAFLYQINVLEILRLFPSLISKSMLHSSGEDTTVYCYVIKSNLCSCTALQ